MPPSSGNQQQDSDVEDIPDELDDDELFEPAGELEVDIEGESDASSESSDDAPPPAKRKRASKPAWVKGTNFDSDISTSPIENFANSHPDLISKSPYELWEHFISDQLISDIVEQTTLYAKRDKNCQHFDLSR
jgi:hypothetical protein